MEEFKKAATASSNYSQSDKEFFNYYSKQSTTPSAIQRFESIRNIVIRKLDEQGADRTNLDVADIGCNAGTQCIMWAREGHKLHGVDVSRLLLDLASERACEAGLDIDFVYGSATNLPWDDESMDVCLVPELLEHVADWRTCLDEFARILRPNGVMYLSTTNYLCPKQQEFRLPLYSWYPSVLKERYERLAMSTRPELANHAKYPAVNWFTFYSLRAELAVRGVDSYDRFDVVDNAEKGLIANSILNAIRAFPALKFLGHIATPSTVVVGVKRLPSQAPETK